MRLVLENAPLLPMSLCDEDVYHLQYTFPLISHIYSYPTTGRRHHHRPQTTSEDPIASNQDASLELLRAAIQDCVGKYVEEKFCAESAAGSVYAKSGQIVVCITGEKPNLRNFWSGKWNSTWTLSIAGASATISGEIKVHAHYFEDGNVQLQTAKPVPPAEIAVGSEKDMAEAIVKHIKASESALQDGLGDMYANMNEETFRSMRRVLPVTRTKMEWNVNAVRMVSQLTGPNPGGKK